jgi:hypothetical protein
VQGRAKIQEHLLGGPKASYRVTQHLPRQGEDNYAEMTAESAGAPPTVHTVRFRTDGHAITKLELVSSRKA